jgi:hypothetical protein
VGLGRAETSSPRGLITLCHIARKADACGRGTAYAERRGIFDARPIILGHQDWPAKDVEGPALYDMHEEVADLIVPSDFNGFGFDEIWLIDNGPKYTSRCDPRTPADFFCFAPPTRSGFGNAKESVGPIGISSEIF